MIRNTARLTEFNRRLAEQEKFTYSEALRLYEGLYNEAVSLGAINSENILEGLEVDLRIARALNGLKRCSNGS